MPILSTFYGIVISMYFLDNRRHQAPHVHARYQDSEAVFDIQTGELIDGVLPPSKWRLTSAWIEIHRDELMNNWKLACAGKPLFRIAPLR